MKNWIFYTCLLSSAVLWAQPSRHAPAASKDTLKSTEVLPTKQVIFRIYAPKASQVTVLGDFSTTFVPNST